MNQGEGPRPLPVSIRNAAIACMLLSAAVGFFSASEALSLAQLSEVREGHFFRIPALGDTTSVEKAMVRALKPMRAPRAAVLAALAVACAFSFVSAGRLLYPSGLSRENMRRLLGVSLLLAALLRTIDGAQWAVVMHRVAKEAGPQLWEGAWKNRPEMEQQGRQLLPAVFSAVSIFQTGIVVGALTLLSHYFRLQRVKDRIATTQNQRE